MLDPPVYGVYPDPEVKGGEESLAEATKGHAALDFDEERESFACLRAHRGVQY